MFPMRVLIMSPSGATELPRTFLCAALLLEIEGHRPSSVIGVPSGVLCEPRVSEGVRDKFTRGLDKLISLMLDGKESGFGGRLVDMERVSEVVIMLADCSGLFLSRDLARSRVIKLGATDFEGRVLERLTVGGFDRDRVLEVDSFDFRGDLFDVSFIATFFFEVQLGLRRVGPPVIDDDSLPPSLA